MAIVERHGSVPLQSAQFRALNRRPSSAIRKSSSAIASITRASVGASLPGDRPRGVLADEQRWVTERPRDHV
jgi:hypothetical protein